MRTRVTAFPVPRAPLPMSHPRLARCVQPENIVRERWSIAGVHLCNFGDTACSLASVGVMFQLLGGNVSQQQRRSHAMRCLSKGLHRVFQRTEGLHAGK
jgi:hypothetical protein